MRPRHLSITGLRSYRQKTDIDFTQDGLLAIVGDTGAGKSSILEAITYALFNATTWDQRGVKSLIADGMQTMVVELTFDADGHCFRLRRSTSRGTSPSPVHLLTCDDDASLPPADGEAQVAAEVRRLVGLDYDGFLAAVVLPQGQFARLLHARPGERTDLLKGIFRLGELDRVRSGVTEARDTARDLLSALHIERAKLRTDPSADLARAESEAARHALRVEALEAVEATLRGSAEAERKAQVDAERLRTTESLVAKSNTRELKKLRALCDVDREIAGRLDELSREREGWQQRHDAAAAQLAVVEREGRTLAVLHRNREELGKARQLEEAAATREVEVGGWRDKATDASRRVHELTQQLPDLAEELTQDEAIVTKFRQARELMERTVLETEPLLRRTREEAKQLDLVLADRKTLHEKLRQQREEQLPDLERANREAARRVQEGEALLAERERTRAAHAVAIGLRSGDPCPVCDRPLPDDWSPPPEGDLEHARHDLRDARRAAEASVAERAAHVAKLEEVEGHLRALDEAIEEQSQLVERHAETLRRVAAEFDPRRCDVDYLADLRMMATRSGEEVLNAQSRADEVRDRLLRTDAEQKAAERERKAAEDQVGSLSANLVRYTKEAASVLASVPERFCPDRSASDPFATALDRLAAELAESEKLDQDRSDARNHLDRLHNQLRQVGERRMREVERPSGQAVQKVLLLQQRLRDAATDLPDITVPDLDPGAGLEVQTLWAQAVEACAHAASAQLSELVENANRRAREARDARQAAVLEAGFDREDEVVAALYQTNADLVVARRDAEDARSQIKPAAELDGAIATGTAVLSNLGQLASLLADGKFVTYVVARRQRVLLELASETLLSVTGGRYGFTEKFEIVDRLSNRTRPAKTLSGGETFLASLSLALGLVEMAGRAGGKLDALFLDEGFGSLDVNALEDAMAALERRASEGKLVCVISHIKAVAERIERVLLVTRTPRGSEVRLADRSERAALVDEELEAGLLQ